MIHTQPPVSKWLSGLDVRALRAVQSIAQEHINAREQMQAQLLRVTASHDQIGPLWAATVYGLGYVEKPGYLVLDGLKQVTALSMHTGGVSYQLVTDALSIVDYDHVLAVYRLHDPERLYHDHLQMQIGNLFRQPVRLRALGDLRYSFTITIPASAEHLFTRANVLRYLHKHIDRVSDVERLALTGQGSQTSVEVRLCLRQS